MKTFRELKENLVLVETKTGRYKGHKWKITKAGSTYALYVDNDKIDIYKSQAEAEKAAKEFIDFQ